ncbi:uncharacterized protein N7511_002821 [Penicillium nucicola]|uniref:uncharacterized protein n=1 Tax=Penicillium nucicola TaxID=1850975 RepID=UPI0025456126|nr:uncharacterized protein N7511_002821 [Penicillium nucicola]KAJ5770770.1 hypothetical protein N7511_002821 [Penicillium nucicola]
MTSRKRSESDAGPDDANKKVKINIDTSKTDSNGDRYWEISKTRRVTVSSFREKNMVNIREYYTKDGQDLPGKKGISLPMDQFSTLITLLPQLEQALKDSGEILPRPAYLGTPSEGETQDHSDSNRSPSKQNIEATSDEDEGE